MKDHLKLQVPVFKQITFTADEEIFKAVKRNPDLKTSFTYLSLRGPKVTA